MTMRHVTEIKLSAFLFEEHTEQFQRMNCSPRLYEKKSLRTGMILDRKANPCTKLFTGNTLALMDGCRGIMEEMFLQGTSYDLLSHRHIELLYFAGQKFLYDFNPLSTDGTYKYHIQFKITQNNHFYEYSDDTLKEYSLKSILPRYIAAWDL
ncbi:hypothetical protein TNCV_1036971 [Trichonephila clavipes]|nr:hypothetical protein TNCV_1036971 [Trichonephila clavipes]